MTELAQFHFLRPLWLLGIPVVLMLAWVLGHAGEYAGWKRYLSKDKLRHLTITGSAKANSVWQQPHRLISIMLLAGLIALAGPSWQALPDKVTDQRRAMVIVLDLSPSMLARDVKPDRLTRARLKLIDLLRHQSNGDSALVVYAGDAHRVTPLTDDPKTIEALVHTLHPEIMPLAGSQAEEAIELAVSLFTNTGIDRGQIVLITDGVHPDASATIKQSLPANIRLSILGIGTQQGSEIPFGEEGLMRDENDNLIIAALDEISLADLAISTGGNYVTTTIDNTDIETLVAAQTLTYSTAGNPDDQRYDSWHDAGYWLALLLLPLALVCFRRQVLWLALPLILMPPEGHALEWQDIWLTKNQQAARAFRLGQLDTAAALFKDYRWAAVSRYRSGDYTAAIKLLSDASTTDDFYNLGNAFAQAGDFDQAITAYTIAIALYADNDDAKYNRKLIEDLIRDQAAEDDAENDRRSGNEEQSESDTSPTPSDTEPTNQNQPRQVGGATGGTNTLDQQTLQEGGQTTDSQSSEVSDPDGLALPDSQLKEADYPSTERQQNDESTFENDLPFEEHDSKVLNPYSEQWLRNLPQDPGGYMRRKLQFQSQLRSQNAKPADVGQIPDRL